ncbi:MAG: hypothetical protein CMN32_17645 [Saprospirales bacterium]|nr:hypothetical protein [Saprospirales bacterium]
MNPKPILILVAGLPASGKTTFANALAKKLGALRLNSDTLREKLNLRGKYDEASKQKVYEAMLTLAEEILLEGKNLVVDSTFYKEALRKPWHELADKTNAATFFIEVTVSDEDARQRLQIPRADSEATWDVYTSLKESWEPIEEPHLKLNASKLSLEEMVEEALRAGVRS